MTYNIHIENLILDGVGVARHERPVVRAAVEGELARLMTEGGLSPELTAGAAVPEVKAGPARMEGGAARLGQGIAQSVYGGIGK